MSLTRRKHPPLGGCGDPGASIDYACWFGPSGQYLTGTAGAGTLVAWVRRARLGAASAIATGLAYAAGDTLAGSAAVYRDPGAWAGVQANANGVWVNHDLVAPGIAMIGTVLGSGLGGYLADVRFYAGVDLDPGSDSYINRFGVPVPLRYAGPLSASDWRREFADPLSLGADTSGNGNHAAATGLTSDNRVTDTPTATFAVLNPLSVSLGGAYVDQDPTGGNLVLTGATGNSTAATALIGHRVFFAVKITVLGNTTYGLGVQNPDSGAVYAYWQDGHVSLAGVSSGYGAAYGVGDWAGCGFDPTSGDIEFFKLVSGSWVSQGTLAGAVTDRVTPWFYASYNTSLTANFGQRVFPAPPPSGYGLLCTADMPCPAIKRPGNYVATRLRADGAGVADLPWDPTAIKTAVLSKSRSNATDWRLNLSTRPGRSIAVNVAGAGDFAEAGGLTFTADGWTIGGAAAYLGSRKDIAWRVSAAAGCDILLVDHVAGTDTTVPHACGGPVDFAVVLGLNTGAIKRLYHRSLAPGQYIPLTSTAVAGTDTGWWSSTAVDLTLGGSVLPSDIYAVIAHRTVAQHSAFGMFTGKGSVDGAFGPTDFLGGLLMYRNIDYAGTSVAVLDTQSDPANPATRRLLLDLPATEDTATAVDITSRGIKARSINDGLNRSGSRIIYAAWAGEPGKFARAR